MMLWLICSKKEQKYFSGKQFPLKVVSLLDVYTNKPLPPLRERDQRLSVSFEKGGPKSMSEGKKEAV